MPQGCNITPTVLWLKVHVQQNNISKICTTCSFTVVISGLMPYQNCSIRYRHIGTINWSCKEGFKMQQDVLLLVPIWNTGLEGNHMLFFSLSILMCSCYHFNKCVFGDCVIYSLCREVITLYNWFALDVQIKLYLEKGKKD